MMLISLYNKLRMFLNFYRVGDERFFDYRIVFYLMISSGHGLYGKDEIILLVNSLIIHMQGSC